MNIDKEMEAVVAYGPKDYRLKRVPTPVINTNELLLEVKGCGICAGDVKCFQGTEMFWGGEFFPPYVKAPVIAGHEFYGQIARIGEQLEASTNLHAGDFITSEQIIPCGKCKYCMTGKYWMCEVHNIRGFQRDVAEGGMARYLKLSSLDRIHKLPTVEPDIKWTMVEPLACAIHVVERAKIGFNDVVVLAGLGPIGLCILQVCKLKNPKLIIALDIKCERLELGKKLGADMVLNPLEEDVIKKVKDITGGYGCDIYIDNTGSPKAVVQGLEMIRKLGTFVEFSVFSEPTKVDWSIIGDRKELNIYGVHLSPYTFPTAINFLDKNVVVVKDIITHTFKLSEHKKAFETAASKEGSLKVVLVP